MHKAGLERLLEGFAIHPGEHQTRPRALPRKLAERLPGWTLGGEFEIGSTVAE